MLRSYEVDSESRVHDSNVSGTRTVWVRRKQRRGWVDQGLLSLKMLNDWSVPIDNTAVATCVCSPGLVSECNLSNVPEGTWEGIGP